MAETVEVPVKVDVDIDTRLLAELVAKLREQLDRLAGMSWHNGLLVQIGECWVAPTAVVHVEPDHRDGIASIAVVAPGLPARWIRTGLTVEEVMSRLRTGAGTGVDSSPSTGTDAP